MPKSKTITGAEFIKLLPQHKRYVVTDANCDYWNITHWMSNTYKRTHNLFNPVTGFNIKLDDVDRIEITDNTFTIEINNHKHVFTIELAIPYSLT